MILRRWHRRWSMLWCGTRKIMKICSVLNRMLKNRGFIKRGISKALCRWELFIDDANILSISNSCLLFFSSFSFANSKNARSLSFSNSICYLVLFACDSMSLVIPPSSWLKAWVCERTTFLFWKGFTTIAFFWLAYTFSTLSSLFAFLDSLSSLESL